MGLKHVVKCMAAAAIAAFTWSGVASAALITQWQYYDEIGFSDYSGDGISVSGNSGDALNLPTTLRWGSGGRNSLIADGNSSGVVSTFGFAPGAGLLHHNQVNPSEFTLGAVTLRNVLQLTPIAPNPPFNGAFTLNGPTLEFDLLFHESPNRPASRVCADGTSIFDPLNIRGCRDIFALANPAELQPIQFAFDEWLYTIAIIAPGVVPLLPDACGAVGLAPGCLGMMTRENATTAFQPYFFISAQPALAIQALLLQVSEPGALALFGAALFALACVRRRERRTDRS